jgi:DNA-binding MarR family transcriptional regulator
MSAQSETPAKQATTLDPACPGATPSLQAWGEVPTHAWTGMHAAHRRLIRCLEQDLFSKHGIGLSGYKLLARLVDAEEGRARMSELADDALLSPSRVSRLVDDLVAREHLERRRCPDDSRVVWAAITDAGREFLTEVHATYVETVEREFFDRLSERDVKALARAFSSLI